MRTRLIAYGFTNSNSISSSTVTTPSLTGRTDPQDFQRAPFIDPSFQNDQNVSSILPGTSRMPQILTWTYSIQRELARNLTLEGTYIGSHSTHLILGGAQSNMNTLDPKYLSLGNLLLQDITSAAAVAAGFTAPYPGFTAQRNRTVGQSLRPYPQYLNVSEEWGPRGISRFNSLQLKVTKRYSSGLTLLWVLHLVEKHDNTWRAGLSIGPGDGTIQIRPTAPVRFP
jgi:hypothetical protein